MAGSSTNLDLIQTAQAQKELTANALFDAGSPATLFGRRASTSVALVWGYYGGPLLVGGTPTQIANGTVTLTASQTNYVEANASGVVSCNTSGFTAGYTPLYSVITGTSTVTSYTDKRVFLYAPQAQPFDVGAYKPGQPLTSEVIFMLPVARSVQFPASLTGSVGKSEIAANGQTDFNILVNGISVGTMRFAASASTATFIAASTINLVAGDVLKVVAPSSVDSALAGVHFVLKGTR